MNLMIELVDLIFDVEDKAKAKAGRSVFATRILIHPEWMQRIIAEPGAKRLIVEKLDESMPHYRILGIPIYQTASVEKWEVKI